MNGTQLHLLVNHVAVIGVPLCAALLAYGLVRGRKEVTAAALGLMVLVALSAVPALLTGEAAEEVVERRGAVPEAVVERHEEFAEPVAYGAGALALLAVAALALTRRSESRLMPTVALAGALAVSGALAWTAHTGGQIAHPEIRASGDVTPVGVAPEAGEAHEAGD